MEDIANIYVVYCKDENGITILKKAYKSEEKAYAYAVSKITTLLNIIDKEFKDDSVNHILPVGAQVIFTLYKIKDGDTLSQYEYFKENHKKFFQYVVRHPIMFYVSKLDLI